MNIAVYLGASKGNDPAIERAVDALGRWIASRKHTLVYGGTNNGLMGVLSDAVKEEGGSMIGVTVRIPMIEKATRNDLDACFVTDDLRERKQIMMARSDAFVAMPGSLGTLDELTDVLADLKTGVLAKPCFVMNIGGFYDPLIALLETMIDRGFLLREELKHLHFVTGVEELGERLSETL